MTDLPAPLLAVERLRARHWCQRRRFGGRRCRWSGLERANWAAGVQVVVPNLFDFTSLRARRAAAGATTRAEVARHDEAALTVTAQQRTADAVVDAARAIAQSLLKLTFHRGTDMSRGIGADDWLRQSRPRVHAARHRGPFHHALRRRHACRWDTSSSRSELAQPGRDSGSGAQPRAPAVCDAARRHLAAAVRWQPAHDRDSRRSRSAARVSAWRPDEVIRAVCAGNVIMPSGSVEHRRRDAHLADELGRAARSMICSRCRSAPARVRRCRSATSHR